MTSSLTIETISPSGSTLLVQHLRPLWYAAYTCARHEKRVAEQFERRSVESFLPLYETVHRWKNGRARLELPLFPGYVFVRIAVQERLRVLEVPSVVRLVGFGGLPTPLPEGEVEAIREGLARNLHAKPHPFLSVGRRVRVRSGPLQGLQGVLVRRKGNYRVVLSMDLIMRSIVVDLDIADLEPSP